MNSVDQAVTEIPNAAGTEDRKAAEELIPLVYEEMRRLAAWHMAKEAAPNTLEATALVHEAYMRLSPGEKRWDGRAHFFSAAAEAMRRILVDGARRRKAARRGGDLRRTEWVEDSIPIPDGNEDEILALHGMLDRLAEIEPRKAEVVKLRYFMGMTIDETAEVLGIASATVRRDMIFAKAWLLRELAQEKND